MTKLLILIGNEWSAGGGGGRLLHCLVCASIGTAGAACAEELLFILINTRRTLENWDSFIVSFLSPSSAVKTVKTAHAHLEETNWPSTYLAMVCVSVWTLPGRFQGSCLTWRRSFLAQFTFGSISCWNSVEKHTCKKFILKIKLSGIKNASRLHTDPGNLNEPTCARCRFLTFALGDLKREGAVFEVCKVKGGENANG